MKPPFLIGRLLMRIRPAPVASMIKHLLFMRRVELATAEGTFWVDPASVLGQILDASGSYESHTLAALRRLLRPGDTFVDVGANEGYFSVVASRLVGAAGHVVAVEPQLRLQEVLRRNFRLNQCVNITVVPAAISDKPGQAQLQLTPDMNNSASGMAAPTRYRLPTQVVTCMTLTELFSLQRVPDEAVMKMDIESWEYEAILGSPGLFRSGGIRALILETHPELMHRRGRNAQELTRFLADCGYNHLADSSGLAWVHSDRPSPCASC